MIPDTSFSAWTIDRYEVEFLESFCRSNEIQSVLEFGPGLSTEVFLTMGASVTSLESDSTYLEQMQEKWKGNDGVRLISYPNIEHIPVPDEIRGVRFDLAFVDGPVAVSNDRRTKPWGRRATNELARQLSDCIIVHDWERDKYLFNDYRDWNKQFIPSPRGIAIFSRK